MIGICSVDLVPLGLTKAFVKGSIRAERIDFETEREKRHSDKRNMICDIEWVDIFQK